MVEPPTRSQGGTSEYLLIVALIVILTLGAFTVFGDDLRRLLDPAGAAAGSGPAGPASAAWPVEVTAGTPASATPLAPTP